MKSVMSAVPHQFHFLLNGKEHCVLRICAENMRDPPGETDFTCAVPGLLNNITQMPEKGKNAGEFPAGGTRSVSGCKTSRKLQKEITQFFCCLLCFQKFRIIFHTVENVFQMEQQV